VLCFFWGRAIRQRRIRLCENYLFAGIFRGTERLYGKAVVAEQHVLTESTRKRRARQLPECGSLRVARRRTRVHLLELNGDRAGADLVLLSDHAGTSHRVAGANAENASSSERPPTTSGVLWCMALGMMLRMGSSPLMAIPPACSAINASGLAS
jgi:hypothetical protein